MVFFIFQYAASLKSEQKIYKKIAKRWMPSDFCRCRRRIFPMPEEVQRKRTGPAKSDFFTSMKNGPAEILCSFFHPAAYWSV